MSKKRFGLISTVTAAVALLLIAIQTTIVLAAPSVQTLTYSAITGGEASLSGDVYSTNPILERGFYYGTDSTLSSGNSKYVDAVNGLGVYSGTINDLLVGTTYYYRAFATDVQGESYGAIFSFQTSGTATVPELELPDISDIGSTEATADTRVTRGGGAIVTERGLVYGTSPNPTTSESMITDSSAGLGSYSADLEQLTPGTTYYVRGYAINSAGTGYSPEATFTTLADLPSVTSGQASEITATTAEIAGEITDDGGAAVTVRGVVYSTQANPTTATGTVVPASAAGSGAYSVELTGLAPGTTYYARAYATNSTGTSYGEDVEFTTETTEPTVTSGSSSGVTASSATVAGEVTANGGATVTVRGIVYSTEANPTLTDGTAVPASAAGNGTYSVELTDLAPGTTYYARAYATNSAGTGYGADVTFTTEAIAPTVTSGQASEITATTAEIAGEVTADGGAAVTVRGVVYSTQANPTTATGTVVPASAAGSGAYSVELTGLVPGTTYYARAYATNTVGTSYGADIEFMANSVAPTVASGSSSGVTASSATVTGEVTANGGATVTVSGIVYSTEANPTLADGTAVPASAAGNGTYSVELTGLAPGTTYYARAYATNSAGTGYGADVSFTTEAIAPTVTSGQASGITTTKAEVSGNVTADGGAAVTVRGIVYSLTANPTLGNGTAVQAAAAGNGAFSVELTGLTPGKTYYARAYATNSEGTSYGSDIEFKTTVPASPPTMNQRTLAWKTTDPRTGSTSNNAPTELIGSNVTLKGVVLSTSGGSLGLPELVITKTDRIELLSTMSGTYRLQLYVIAPDGTKLTGPEAKLIFGQDGIVTIESGLIQPYGTVKDAVTGKPIDGVRITLYWADTERNRAEGRTAGQQVSLPALTGMLTANANPQSSLEDGRYGWLVYPTGDYYLIAEKSGYERYDSRDAQAAMASGSTGLVYNFSMKPLQEPGTPVDPTEPGQPEEPGRTAYLQGYDTGQFMPEKSLTRAEMATILNRVLTQKAVSTTASDYPDTRSHWAQEAIRTAGEQGWMRGYPSGNFEPQRSMTRAEFAQVLFNVLGLTETAGSSYTDVSNHWGAVAIAAVEREGLLSGYPDGTFQPDKLITRAEAVHVMNKLLGIDATAYAGQPVWSDVPTSHWAYRDIMIASVEQ